MGFSCIPELVAAPKGQPDLQASLPGIIPGFLALEKQWDRFSLLCLQFLIMMFPSIRQFPAWDVNPAQAGGLSKQGTFLGDFKLNLINPS